MRRTFYRMINEDTGRVVYSARIKKAGSPLVHIYQCDGHHDASMAELKRNENLVAVLEASLDYMTHRLVVDQRGRSEIAVIVFEKNCYHSDRFHILCPPHSNDNITPHTVGGGEPSMVQYLRSLQAKIPDGYTHLRTKDPTLQDGVLRLNFNGRARVPSTRNFQVMYFHVLYSRNRLTKYSWYQL